MASESPIIYRKYGNLGRGKGQIFFRCLRPVKELFDSFPP